MPTSLATPPSPAQTATGRLALAYAGEDALLAELSKTPQTIGGGPKCTIRLDGTGLRPLHCVVTSSGSDHVVRRWAAGTQLNGRDFTEAALSAGDLLRIGSVDIRVIALGDEDGEPETVPAETTFPEDAAPAAELAPSGSAVPSAEDPVNEEPEPAPADPLEWIDDSVAQVEETIAQAAEASSRAESSADPAIPSHLLQPWQPSDGTPPAAPRDTASSIVELNPILADPTPASPPAAATTPPVDAQTPAAVEPTESEPEPDAAAEPSDPWAVDSVAESPDSAVPAVDVSSASAWEAEFATPADAEPEPQAVVNQPADSEAVAAFFEAASIFAEASSATDETPETADESSVAPEPVLGDRPRDWAEARRAADRDRVHRLVAALREHRGRLAGFEAAIAERDAIIHDSQSELAEAIDAADRAGVQLANLVDSIERAEASEAQLAEAQQRITELEARLAEWEANAVAAAVETTAPEAPAEAVSDFVPEPVQEAIGIEAAQPLQPLEAAHESTNELPEEPPAELWPTSVAAAGLSNGIASPVVPEAIATEPPAAEEAWGIEQMTEEPNSAAASLWGSVDDQAGFGGSVEQPADEAELPAEPTPAEADPGPIADSLEVPTPATPADASVAGATDWEQVELPSGNLAEESVAAVDEFLEPEPEPEFEPPADISPDPSEGAEAVEVAPAPLAAFQPKPAEPAESGPAEPASFIEQYAHTLPAEDEPVEAPAPIAAVPAIDEMSPPSEESGEDESIDDYMRKLMQRVRGESETPPAPAPTAATPAVGRATVTAATPVAPTPDPEPVAPTVEPMKCLSEMKTNTKPKPTTDLGALRQLANQSARHAIDVAETKQSREQATLRLTAAAVVMGCGALAAITAPSLFGLQLVAGIAGVAGGGWFGVKTLKACQMASQEQEMAAAAKGKPVA